MAIRYAIKNGNWSDSTTWNGGLGLPTSTDDVRSNNFTVTADVNTLTTIPTNGETTVPFSYQVGKVTATKNGSPFTAFTATNGTSIALNIAANGTDEYVFTNAEWQVLTAGNGSEGSPPVLLGGTFILTSGIVLRANTFQGSTATEVIQFTGTSPGQASIYGDPTIIVGGGRIVSNNSSGTLNIFGNSFMDNGTGNLRRLIVNFSSGTINIAGNITTGGQNALGVLNGSTGTVNILSPSVITSSSYAGTSATAVSNVSTGTINIASGCTINPSNSGSSTISNSGGGVININTNITATSVGNVVSNTSTGTVNITGIVTGNSSSNGYAVQNSTGTLSIVGEIRAGSITPAIGPGTTSQLTFLTGPFIGHPNGTQANIAQAWRWNLANPTTYIEVYSSDLLNPTPRRLYTADFVGGNPSASNVRKNATFGPVGELTGTMAVPAPEFVKGGVGVDNTVGTAITTGADIWNASMGLVSGAPGTVGERLKNTATIQSVGAQIEALGA